MKTSLQKHQVQQGMIVGLAIVTTIMLFMILSHQLPFIGVDYYYTYRPVAEKWLHGETHLYDTQGSGYFNAPWTLILIVPLSLPGFEVGLAIWNTLSLFGIIIAILIWSYDRRAPRYVVILALLNLHTLDMLVRGQIDSLILIGVVLGWWAIQTRHPWGLALAFTLLAVKPLNVVLVGLLFLMAMRQWTWSDRLRSISLMTILVVLSGFLLGLDWPLRYIHYVQDTDLYNGIQITLWKGATQSGLPLWPFVGVGAAVFVAFVWWGWQVGATRWMVCVAVTTNLVFTTYANGNHYILLVPAFIYLAWHDWRLVIPAYLLTWTPFSRFMWADDASWIDVFYAILLLVTSWYFGLRSHYAGI